MIDQKEKKDEEKEEGERETRNHQYSISSCTSLSHPMLFRPVLRNLNRTHRAAGYG